MSRFSRRRVPFILFAVVLVLALVGCLRPRNPATETAPDEYLFCFWNVENLFDDQHNGWSKDPDKEFDAWFADNPKVLREKLDHLTDALLGMNGGKGPDILALAEVESLRAAELLRDALNARLSDQALHYQHVLFKDPHAGRHIATAIITRLPVVGDRTRLLGRRQRILEARIHANGHELVVIASHWTSRLTDKTGKARADYADKIYGEFRAMYESNKAVDVLICGDFNDSPDDPSVTTHLHAATPTNRQTLAIGAEPTLLDLFTGKDPKQFGTHYYHQWFIFDQILVSPGLLDNEGWTCDPDTATTIRTGRKPGDRQGHPWSFGSPKHGDRGASDHFPVTVKLKVQ